MSLTSQLHHGELGEWCTARLVGAPTLARAVAAAASRREPVRPLAAAVPAEHWAEIGGAFGARLAALVQPAPPYYALYGLVRAGLVSREWADAQAAEWPTHHDLPASHRIRALELRPSPAGWLDCGEPTDPGVPAGTAAEPVLAELLARTRDYQQQHAPPGSVGSPGVEAGLARSYWWISHWEDIYRSGQIPAGLHELFAGGRMTVEALRSAVPDETVAELVALAGRLRESGALAQLRRIAGDPPAGQPLGHAGPVMIHHWADGDLLLAGPAGGTLIDIKTVVRADNLERTARWLAQILAYAWLDTADRWRIRSVGLYLARHGVALTWDLDTFADALLGGTGRRQKARQEFRRLAARVAAAEGATTTP